MPVVNPAMEPSADWKNTAWTEWRKQNTKLSQSLWQHFDTQERMLELILGQPGVPLRYDLQVALAEPRTLDEGQGVLPLQLVQHSKAEDVDMTMAKPDALFQNVQVVQPPDLQVLFNCAEGGKENGEESDVDLQTEGEMKNKMKMPKTTDKVESNKMSDKFAGKQTRNKVVNKMGDKIGSNKTEKSDNEGPKEDKSSPKSSFGNLAGDTSSSQTARVRPTGVSFAVTPPAVDAPEPPHLAALPSLSDQEALPMSMPISPKSVEAPKKGGRSSPGLVANGWQRAAKKLQAAQAMTMTHTASISSNKHLQQASGKLRKKIAFLRAESNLENSKMSCVCLDRLAQKATQCCELISSLISPLRNLEEPPRQSILANVIRHKAFEATIMLAVIANTAFIAYETNYEMENLGEILLVGQVVEIVFLVFFSLEIGLRLWVHGLYFLVNEDWSWNLMDAVLMFFAYLDQVLEYVNASVGKVGMLRLLRVTRLFRIIRVLRFLREVRIMLVAILGSFISLFWALSMLAVIIFMFAIYFMQQMSTYLSSTQANPDELWQSQWDYFNNLGASMYVLLMASTGGKDWEEVYLLLSPLGFDSAFAFTFYLLFFTLGVMNIITGVFVENASVLFKPDDREALSEYMRQVQDDIEQVTAILQVVDKEGSGFLSVSELIAAMKNDRFEHALRTVGIDIRMPEHYFKTLASVTEQDELSIDEFVAHIVQMKGSVSRTDVQTLTLETALLQREVKKLASGMKQILSNITQLQAEQSEIHDSLLREGHEDWNKGQTSLRDGLYEEFLKHQREMIKRAEGRGTSSTSLSFSAFNWRTAVRSIRKVGPDSGLAMTATASTTSSGKITRGPSSSWPAKRR